VEWAKLKTGQKIGSGTCPVLITTTPVFGYAAVEFIQRSMLNFVNWIEGHVLIQLVERVFDIEGCLTGWMVDKLDAESWDSNKAGFVNFMDTVSMRMGINRCVFLSGDVHYAFTANASFQHQDGKLQCFQMTSSALSNEPDAMQSRFLEKSSLHKTGKRIHRNWSVFPSKYWTSAEQLLNTKDGNLRVNAKCNLGLVEFAGGAPVSHTLLTGEGALVYQLPRAEA
jgi:hypothetical protein